MLIRVSLHFTRGRLASRDRRVQKVKRPRIAENSRQRNREGKEVRGTFSFALSLSLSLSLWDFRGHQLGFHISEGSCSAAATTKAKRGRNELSTVVGGNSPAASLDIRLAARPRNYGVDIMQIRGCRRKISAAPPDKTRVRSVGEPKICLTFSVRIRGYRLP